MKLDIDVTPAMLDRAKGILRGKIKNAIAEIADREPREVADMVNALAALEQVKATLADKVAAPAPRPEDDTSPAFKVLGDLKIPTGNTVGEEKRAASDPGFAQELNKRRNRRESGEAAKDAGAR